MEKVRNALLRFIENVLKCGTATFPTWRQRTLYDNNCIIIFYFVSGKVEQNESRVCFGCINQRRRPATYSHHIFLFGNFRLEMYKNNNNKKGKNVVFFQKGLCGYKYLWLSPPGYQRVTSQKNDILVTFCILI